MGQEWRIKITGKQRRELDRDLLIQALIALGRQFQREAATNNRDAQEASQEDKEAA